MAKLVDVGSIVSYFDSLDDPRHTRDRKHLLVDIVVITVCAIICGCDGPTAIHRWAKHRQSWLAQHLALSNGIPSRDCIRRTLIVLKPQAFQRGFQASIRDTITVDANDPDRLVAIDGKTCRRSHDKAKTSVRCISSVPGPASRGLRRVRSPPTPNPTRSPPSPNCWSRST
jgi:DDE_Tnp_1-associated